MKTMNQVSESDYVESQRIASKWYLWLAILAGLIAAFLTQNWVTSVLIGIVVALVIEAVRQIRIRTQN